MTQTDKTTHTVICSQILQNYLIDLKATGAFKMSLKMAANNFLKQLEQVETDYYDKFFQRAEESTIHVFDVYENFIKEISSVPIWEMENLTQVLKAYKKDQKSLEGITKKVLRN